MSNYYYNWLSCFPAIKDSSPPVNKTHTHTHTVRLWNNGLSRTLKRCLPWPLLPHPPVIAVTFHFASPPVFVSACTNDADTVNEPSLEIQTLSCSVWRSASYAVSFLLLPLWLCACWCSHTLYCSDLNLFERMVSVCLHRIIYTSFIKREKEASVKTVSVANVGSSRW